MIHTPRIQLFSDFLDQDDWQVVSDYCKDTNTVFNFVGHGSPVRWQEHTHSQDNEFKYYRSFLISEEEPSHAKKHGDLYKVYMQTYIDNESISIVLNKMLDKIQNHIEVINNKKVMKESGPWITKMSVGDYMSMHCDGTFIVNKDKTAEYSIIYYINDDFSGGEFNMPKMGFRLKPKANSLLLFSNSFDENMAHEVTEVVSGDRYISQSWFSTVL